MLVKLKGKVMSLIKNYWFEQQEAEYKALYEAFLDFAEENRELFEELKEVSYEE